MTGRVPVMLTDDELDAALAAHGGRLPFTADARSRALARLRAAAAEELAAREPAAREPAAREPAAEEFVPAVRTEPAHRPSRHRLLAAAATVVLIAAGAVAAPLLWGDAAPVASAAAARNLDLAATGRGDPVPRSGQYLLVDGRAWSLSSATTATGKPLSALVETLSQVWIPADRSQVWVKRSGETGARSWVVGSEELARAEGDGGMLDPRAFGVREQRGACGDFPGWNGQLGDPPVRATTCADRSGSWDRPSATFLAGLPRDPEQLYRRLRADARSAGDALQLAAALLRTGEAPHDLRAALFLALKQLPGLDVTDGAADLAGRVGVGLGLTEGDLRDEIVVDPGTGAFLGEREVLTVAGTGAWEGLPAGTVVNFTAVTTAVTEGPPR